MYLAISERRTCKSHIFSILFQLLFFISKVSEPSRFISSSFPVLRRVIRHCHPDKHMHLPPRSPAFLELQKIFTILSDSYNRYKAAQS